jgi:hypothetical protein
VVTEKGKTLYLNSGDWVEHLTSLEYSFGNWEIIQCTPSKKRDKTADDLMEIPLPEKLMELVTS